jgi:multiple sugar transport system substrate-binding protein
MILPAVRSVFLALVLTLLFGCSGQSDEREVVHFWALGREGEVVTQLIPEFERLNPGIRVKVQQIPFTVAHEKLLTAFAGGVTPDVAQLGTSWVAELVALGALEPLDAPIAASLTVEQADYFAGGWTNNVIGGRTWGVPWYADTRLLFYRQDLLREAGFARPPQSWAEWVAAMRAIKARAAPRDYAIFLPVNEYEPLLALSLQQPEPLLREDGRYGNFRSPGFVRASDFYLSLFREGLAPPLNNTQISNLYDEFARGHFAFYISGPWNIGEFKRRMPPERQDDWMTAPLPGPDGPGASIAGGSALAVFARSERKAAAWKLVEFLSRPEIQLRFFELTGDLPPRRSVWRAPVLADDVYAAAFRDQLERAKPPPQVPEWERLGTQMRIVTERAVAGQLSPAAFRATLDADADRMLAKRRSLMAPEAGQ